MIDNSDIDAIIDEMIWLLNDKKRIREREEKIDKLLNDERLFGDKAGAKEDKK